MATAGRGAELRDELQALRLAAAQGVRRLAELEVAEAEIDEERERTRHLRDGREHARGLRDVEVEDRARDEAVQLHVERLAIEAPAAAGLAGSENVAAESSSRP